MKKVFFEKLITYTALTIVAVIVLLPMEWGFANAFRSDQEIGSLTGLGLSTFIPQHFTLDNFREIFNKVDFVRVFLNTFTVSVIVTVGNLLLTSMAAYAFARLNFKGKKLIFIIIIATLALPLEILILPLYILLQDMRMIDTYSALIIPFLANAFGIFFMRQCLLEIPKSIDEAAFIDGARHSRIFFQILLPLTKNSLLTLGLITFLQQWDGFIAPVTLINSKEKMFLQVALNYLSYGEFTVNWGIIFAGMVLASVPVALPFIFLQKYYASGIASGGVKG